MGASRVDRRTEARFRTSAQVWAKVAEKETLIGVIVGEVEQFLEIRL
jgi:hypothetical protein